MEVKSLFNLRLLFLQNRRQLISLALAVLLMVVAIYVVFPKLVGVSDAIGKLSDATWYWVVVAIAFNGVRFLSYTSLFRGVLSGTQEDTVNRRLDLRASYQITMAGFAATILTVRNRTLPAHVLGVLNNSPLYFRFAGGFALVVPSLIFIFFMRRYLLNMWGRVTK